MLQHSLARQWQHVAPNNVAICCVGKLQSFGRGLKLKINLLVLCIVVILLMIVKDMQAMKMT